MFLNLECNGTHTYPVYYGHTATCHTLQLVKNHHFYCLDLTAVTLLRQLHYQQSCPNATEVIDYREELVLNLSSARALSAKTISKAQQNQTVQYDQHTSSSKLRVGDWILIYFPQDETGKHRKLSRPWHGPYCIISCNNPDVTAATTLDITQSSNSRDVITSEKKRRSSTKPTDQLKYEHSQQPKCPYSLRSRRHKDGQIDHTQETWDEFNQRGR